MSFLAKQTNVKVSTTSGSSFTECSVPKSPIKINSAYSGVDRAILRKNGVLPLHKACHNKIVAAPLPGFVASSRGLLQEEGGLSKARPSDEFDLNAYKLIKRSGYDFSKPPLLGSVIEARPYGLNDTQKMIQKQGDGVVTPRTGLGYVPSQPVKISGRRKEEQSLVQYITTEEADHEGDDQATSSSRASVFDRVQPSTPHQRPSVFERMGRDKTPKPFVLQRLQGGKQPKPSVFTRVKIGGKSSCSSPVQDGDSVYSRLGEVNEVQSSVPSRMKHVSTLDVKTDGSLKIKRRTLVITSYWTSSNSKGKIKDEEQPSSHPVTIREADDLEDDTQSAEVTNTSENVEGFQHGSANGQSLKHYFP